MGLFGCGNGGGYGVYGCGGGGGVGYGFGLRRLLIFLLVIATIFALVC
ncbi:sporulation protein YjcZ [Salinithrix halophila]|uniref:Sporulation protein YjcZ n=1 Tax=Salinithrix halophila TaxID=1485204 RepID=A0ABV8JGN2_9BACL